MNFAKRTTAQATITTIALIATLVPATTFAEKSNELANKLEGRWSVEKLAGEVAMPAGDISFAPGQNAVSGATACNLFRGEYTQKGDSRLTIKTTAMTRRSCYDAAAAREKAFLDAMRETSRFKIQGNRLTLTRDDGSQTAELTRAIDAKLEGAPHKIVSFSMDGGLHSAPAQTGATITFKDGTIDGNTGCRTFKAKYARDEENKNNISVRHVEPAKSPDTCPDDTKDQDAAIIAALPAAKAFDISRNLIRLLDNPDGNAVLWITPANE
ncbi:MAG: META domain-containing protein [Hyphomicrobiaceae bacterium]